MDFSKVDQTESVKIPHLTILVVDDDELNQRMMRVLLTREGHQVEAASNGLEAFESIKSREFDIVFMDLQMPVMDGVEASRKIREWENEGRHTFIVALTASYLPEDGQKLFEAGIDNYISKPFELDHIQRMLNYRSNFIQSPSLSATSVQGEEISINEVLDIQKGVQRVGGDAETYWDLLGDFIHELPEKTEALQRYFADGDLEGLSRAAHNLKGVSANLGALQLSRYADRLDRQSSGGYTESIDDLLREIKIMECNLREIAHIFLSGRGLHSE